jgi:hypothetical protein
MASTAARLQDATTRADAERARDAARRAAIDETADTRTKLRADARDLIDALDTTRAQRVRDAARDPSARHDLHETLGPPPGTVGGMAAWCGIADRVERYRDHHGTHGTTRAADPATRLLGGRPSTRRAGDEWDEAASLVRAASNIIEHAHRHDLSVADSQRRDDPRYWKHAVERSAHMSANAVARERGADAGIEL